MNQTTPRRAVLAAALGALGLSACSSGDGTAPSSTGGEQSSSGAAAPEGDMRLVVYGDSISVLSSEAFEVGKLGDRAWPAYLPGTGFQLAGGYAVSGYTVADVLPYVRTVGADLRIAFLGTNDLGRRQDFAESARDFETLATRAGVTDPSRFALVTVGPINDLDAGLVSDWNRQVRALAARHGWFVLDPWDGLRTSANTWVSGMDVDGLHPSAAGAKRLCHNVIAGVTAQKLPT
ncbi:SGNH/GDSL hydrolase family protein [Dermacoccaceae bacterium W4C1]